MRTITTDQRNRQKAAGRNYYTRIETQNGDTVPLWKDLSALGTWQANGNPDFAGGSLNGYIVYDNGVSGTVTLSVVADPLAPNYTGYVMKIAHAIGGAPSPGIGGFYKGLTDGGSALTIDTYRRGSSYLRRIWAKIPVGSSIQFSSNPYGTEGTFTWLTSTAGTGGWFEYIGRQVIGTTGVFSTTGHFFLDAGTRPLDWFVASNKFVLEDATMPEVDFVDTWRAESNIDQSVAQATVTLHRETENFSLAPLMGASLLNRKSDNSYSPLLKAGRRLRIVTAITLPGVAPVAGDWIEIFIGKIDKVNWGQDPVTIECRDLGAYLQRRWIEAKVVYNEGAQVPLKAHVQLLINTWKTNPPTIMGADPGANIDGYTQDQDSLFEAARTLFQLIGWDLRYKYNASGVSELTAYLVLRDKIIADDTIGPAEYFDVTNISVSDVDLRNRVRVLYLSPFGVPGEVLYEDAASIAENDVQYMQIGPEEAKTIRNSTDAMVLATAAVKELSISGADHDILCSFLWHVELGDLLTFLANGVHYDTDQKFALYGFAHEGVAGDITTTLTTRGKPAGMHKTWLKKFQDRSGTSPELKIDIKITGGDSTFVEYTVTTNLDTSLLYAFGDDPFVTPVPADGKIIVPRATNDSGDRLLRVQATTPNGASMVEAVTVDFDTTPELSITAEAIPIFAGNVQTGWRIKGTCDDDCRAIVFSSPNMPIVAVSPAGTSPAAGIYWANTTNTKTWSIDLTQGAGETATVTITPREFYNVAAGGAGGQPAAISLSRAPVTSHSVRALSATSREITLSVVPTTATIKYRVNAGVWQERNGGTTVFVEDVEAAPVTIEYLSYTATGTSEELKRLVVDQNDQPGFVGTPQLLEIAQNKLQLNVGFDDDVVLWRMWARRGAWPSVEQVNPAIWAPLEEYKRYDGGVERNSVDWTASGASLYWYVVVRAYDAAGVFVQWWGTILLSAAAPPAVGSLNSVAANRVTHADAKNYHDITWNHNATVQTVSHTVTIRENGVQIVAGRDARLEHDGAAVVANVGGYHHEKVFANASDPGAEFLTSTYEVELRRVSDGGLVATYGTSVSGYYAPGGGGSAPPTEVANTLVATAQVLQARATWLNGSPTWPMRIEWSKTTGVIATVELSAATLEHILTGLVYGDIVRFRIQYYNSYGNGPWSAYSAYSGPVQPPGDPPSEVPTNLQAQGFNGAQARAVWVNTSSAYNIRVEWFLNGVGYNTELANPGVTQTPYSQWTIGDLVKFRVQYYNNVGNGPWSVFSNQILIHA